MALVRQKGFTATSVDDLCRHAGVTKGAFFHHFASKDELGISAAKYWSETTGALFEAAPFHTLADPLDRVLAYIDFRRDIISGDISEFTCLVGTMAQEAHTTAPDIAKACGDSIFGHAETLVSDISDAMDIYNVTSDWTAESLARHTQAAIQGGFILAKAGGGTDAAKDAITHLRRYISLLFKGTPE